MLNTGVDPYLYGIPLESFCEWLSPFVRLPLQEVVENHIVARANLSVLGQVLFPPGIAVAEVFMPEDGPHCLSLFCDYAILIGSSRIRSHDTAAADLLSSYSFNRFVASRCGQSRWWRPFRLDDIVAWRDGP